MSDVNILNPYLIKNTLVAVGTKKMTFLGMVDSNCEFVQIYVDNLYDNAQYLSFMNVDNFEPFDGKSNMFLSNVPRTNTIIEPISFGDEISDFFVRNKNVVIVGPARENRFINYCHRALTFFGIDSILPLSASAADLVVSSPLVLDYFRGLNTERLHEIEDARIDNAGFVLCASTTPIGVNTQREVDYAMSKEVPGFNLSTFTAAKDKAFREIDIKGGN